MTCRILGISRNLFISLTSRIVVESDGVLFWWGVVVGVGPRKMAQCLGACTAHGEDPDWVPSTLELPVLPALGDSTRSLLHGHLYSPAYTHTYAYT